MAGKPVIPAASGSRGGGRERVGGAQRHGRDGDGGDQGAAGRQAVEAVDEVGGVGGEEQPGNGERSGEEAERNGADAVDGQAARNEDDRSRDLSGKLGAKAELADIVGPGDRGDQAAGREQCGCMAGLAGQQADGPGRGEACHEGRGDADAAALRGGAVVRGSLAGDVHDAVSDHQADDGGGEECQKCEGGAGLPGSDHRRALTASWFGVEAGANQRRCWR